MAIGCDWPGMAAIADLVMWQVEAREARSHVTAQRPVADATKTITTANSWAR